MAKSNNFIFLSAVIIIAFIGFFNFSQSAYAMTPVLSLSATGSGDNVQINVTGDANVSVLLFMGSQSALLGDTNSGGTFSTVVSSATVVPNGIVSNATVYVKTNGFSGSQSNNASWPYIQSSNTTSTLTLSQTALLLNAGQTSTITASASYLYLLSNSQPTIANVNFNASQITVQALTYGSTVVNICVVGSTSNCASITITVQNSSSQQLNFSQNNFSIVSGQSIPVTISGGSGYYTISNNSNSSSIQTSLSGSIITLTGISGSSSGSGSSSITVCTTDMADCGIINVSATTLNSTAVSFSQTNPVVPLGQSTTVTIYGGTGSNFYVSSNSNPSIVQANVNGNILTLIGNASTGTSAISVCAYAGSCGSLTANVSSTGSSGAISLSQNTIYILAGQSSNITILGGSAPYTISAPNSSNIFNGVVNGNTLTIYGVNPGSATANVCSSVGCTTLSITISSTTSSANPPAFSQNNILLNIGQQTTVYVSGGGASSGSYYVSSNSAPTVASEQISGSAINVVAMQAGTASVAICQSGGQCATLYITVSGTSANTTAQLVLGQSSLSLAVGQNTGVYITGGGNYNVSSNSNSTVASAAISGNSVIVTAISAGTDNISICQNGGQCANLYVTVSGTAQTSVTTPVTTSFLVFSRYLFYGLNGEDVLQLQKILFEKGFLSATPNGHYGRATEAAVKAFQKAHGLSQLGVVGPGTRAILNQIFSSTTSIAASTTTNTQKISAIQAEIQQLLAQVAQMQGH